MDDCSINENVNVQFEECSSLASTFVRSVLAWEEMIVIS